MVMDVTPSPQCVGREFVRQYYTLLNEAPQYLHRFYSNNSSFIHGGDEKPGEEEQQPVIGQTEIHKKIMSLGFNDCHAKIRYVDSQATVGTAVVVQVTGELSNNREPLRRFMQTFVLAPQTPNKYYVHNDIFRYQDEVFNDSDEEDELVEQEQHQHTPQKQPEKHVDQSAQIDRNMAQQNNMNFYQQQQQQQHVEQHVSEPQQHIDRVTPEPVLTNGHNGPEQASPPEPARVVRQPTPEPQVVESEPEAPEPPVESYQPEEPAAPVVEQAPAEPKAFSWANVVNKNSPAPAAPAPAAAPVPQTAAPASFPEPSMPPASSPPEKQQQRQHMRGNRANMGQDRGFGDTAKPSRVDEGSGGEERRQERTKYPDAQQVFVGNLPANISEFELKDFFKSYGTVLEVRINRMSSNKIPFGFVVFEEESCAQEVLGNKQSLEYKGQRLNVEEKKPRNEGRPHSNTRHGGQRRDGHRHMRGRGGFGGPPRTDREDSGNRTAEQGRYNNLNKSNQHRR